MQRKPPSQDIGGGGLNLPPLTIEIMKKFDARTVQPWEMSNAARAKHREWAKAEESPEMQFNNIPEDLKGRQQWVGWAFIENGKEKPAKVPLNIHTGKHLSWNTADAWVTFQEACDAIHDELTARGIAVLYDDRSSRPGVKFADCDLLGIPHRIVVGERGLDGGTLEYKHRRSQETEEVALETLGEFLAQRIADALGDQ